VRVNSKKIPPAVAYQNYLPHSNSMPTMNLTKDPGYRIVGVYNGWMVKTDQGSYVCPFIMSKDENSPQDVLKKALRFTNGC